MSIDILPLIDLGTISFHTGVKSSPFNDGLPNTAPFNVGLRSYVNLLVQVPYADVSRYLAKAYEKGSMIGTPMSEVGVGRKYTEDFLEFILKNVNLQNEDRPRILEIGCGTGYLLYRLKRLGLRVLGIEPGEQGQTGSLKYDLEIIQDTFPGKMIGYGERFELIIHYGVLEHIENPVTFLQKQAEYLSEYGSTIFAVPNCQEYILSGNISMFVHEHWNYFTPYSLNKVIEKAGMKLLRLESARYGGAIYGIAGKTGQAIDIAEEFNWPQQFEDRMQQFLKKIEAFFQKCMNTNCSVGIFCPGRIINLLHIIRPENVLRFFDDDKLIHGKYYPPFDVPIESRSSLINKPVDELIIMSSSFGEKLRNELIQEKRLEGTKIRLLPEIIGIFQ